jgi:signal transduction histidine kinase
MTAAALALERLHQSQVAQLAKAVALIDAHADDLGAFITSDPHGQHLPMFSRHLAQHLLNERETIIEHLHTVNDRIEHIKEIVILQQSYATTIGIIEPIDLTTLMDDAIKTQDDNFDKYEVEIVREYAELALVLTDRHKVLQILINLLSNAKHALLAVAPAGRRLTVRVGAVEADQVCLEVEDNGVGIGASELTQIFQHGYTTKASGHGFGLHSCALTARELGGHLCVHSDGPGQGARFRLELPRKEAILCVG